MFEKNIQIAKESLLREINFTDKFVYLNEITANPSIHQAYKDYFRAEVAWWIYEKQAERRNSMNFDYSDPDMVNIIERLDNKYFETARFDSATLFNIVETAVKVRANMVCRPRNTLRWFVFRLEKTKPFGEITRRMDYLGDYTYLRSRFTDEAKDSGVVNGDNSIISAEYFSSMVEKIDDSHIYSLNPEEFSDLIEPVFSFFNPGVDFGESRVVPVESLVIFLDDKNIYSLAEKLESLYRENITTISKKYITDFIYNQIDLIELGLTDTHENVEEVAEDTESIIEYSEIFTEDNEDELPIADDLVDSEGIEYPEGILEARDSNIDDTAVELEEDKLLVGISGYEPEPEVMDEIPDEDIDELITEFSEELDTDLTDNEDDNPEIPSGFDEMLLQSLLEPADDLNEEKLELAGSIIDANIEDEETPEIPEDARVIPEDLNFDIDKFMESEPEDSIAEPELQSLEDELLLSSEKLGDLEITEEDIAEPEDVIIEPDSVDIDSLIDTRDESTNNDFEETLQQDMEMEEFPGDEEILNMDIDEILLEKAEEPEATEAVDIDLTGLGSEFDLNIIPDSTSELPVSAEDSVMPDIEPEAVDDILQEIDFDSILAINPSSSNDLHGDSHNDKNYFNRLEDGEDLELDDEDSMEMRGRIISIMENFEGKNGNYKEILLNELKDILSDSELSDDDITTENGDNINIEESYNETSDLIQNLNMLADDGQIAEDHAKTIYENLYAENGGGQYLPETNEGDVYFIDKAHSIDFIDDGASENPE